MWKQTVVWTLALFVLVSAAIAVNLNTNITLTSACTDAYGNLCTGTDQWTVINPNGTKLYDQAGGDVSNGLDNFTFWANMTGVYFVYVNYTGQNISVMWNVVVEDYKTVEIKSLYDETKMMLIGIIIVGIIASMMYASFQLGEEHVFLKVLLLFGSLFFMIGGLAIGRSSLAETAQIRITDTLFYILIVFCVVLVSYLVIYILMTHMKNAASIAENKKDKNKVWQ